MYNSSDMTMDEELTFLSYNQCINAEFSVDDIVTGDLWSVTTIKTGLYKAVPLFNCDSISSSNSKDKVLESNKAVILFDDEDTLVTVSSDDTGSIHFYSIQVYAFTPYTVLDLVDELTVYCVVYDEYLNTLNNVNVNVCIDGEVTTQVQTDNNGLCKYTISEPCEIGFCYDSNLSNTITITGGE